MSITLKTYIDASRSNCFYQSNFRVSFTVLELISFGNDPVSAGFGLFNAGGIIFMIFGIGLSKPLADKFGKRNVFAWFLFISTTLFILVFYFLINYIYCSYV